PPRPTPPASSATGAGRSIGTSPPATTTGGAGVSTTSPRARCTTSPSPRWRARPATPAPSATTSSPRRPRPADVRRPADSRAPCHRFPEAAGVRAGARQPAVPLPLRRARRARLHPGRADGTLSARGDAPAQVGAPLLRLDPGHRRDQQPVAAADARDGDDHPAQPLSPHRPRHPDLPPAAGRLRDDHRDLYLP